MRCSWRSLVFGDPIFVGRDAERARCLALDLEGDRQLAGVVRGHHERRRPEHLDATEGGRSLASPLQIGGPNAKIHAPCEIAVGAREKLAKFEESGRGEGNGLKGVGGDRVARGVEKKFGSCHVAQKDNNSARRKQNVAFSDNISFWEE